jgi:hypothetical protein
MQQLVAPVYYPQLTVKETRNCILISLRSFAQEILFIASIIYFIESSLHFADVIVLWSASL